MIQNPYRVCLSLAVVLLLAATSFAQELQKGAAPPPLGIEKLLQAPDGSKASWDAFKGQVVVLEFWATWCLPCIQQIPHMNQLVEKFKGRPVQFLSVTDEPEEIVAPFLKSRPMRPWIGLDTDSSMIDSFQVYAIPYMVLVDGGGKVVALLHPAELTEGLLDKLVAAKPSAP